MRNYSKTGARKTKSPKGVGRPGYRTPSAFRNKVLVVVRGIPKGSLMTYGQVARAAGNPRAARAVGAILRKNANTNVPCHRVIRADGTLGGYNGLCGNKKELLMREGALKRKR